MLGTGSDAEGGVEEYGDCENDHLSEKLDACVCELFAAPLNSSDRSYRLRDEPGEPSGRAAVGSAVVRELH